MSATPRQNNIRGRHSHPSPPWYSPQLCARSGLHPLGGYRHSSYFGRKAGVVLVAYLWPSRPLNGTDLSASFGGVFPVLMFGVLNAKQVDWKSRLSTKRGKLLRAYAHENSCLIFAPDSQTTIPYNLSITPDVLDIVITKNHLIPVYLTSRSALSSGKPPGYHRHNLSLIFSPPMGPP